MKKLFSKTVAVVLSAACVGSLLTASFDGKPLFVQERIVHAANADIENFESFDGFVSAGAIGVYDKPSFSVKALKYLNKNDKVTIYESKNGYGKINKSKDEWVYLSCIGYKATIKSRSVDACDGNGGYVRRLSKGTEVKIYQVYNGKARITESKYNVFNEVGTMMPYTYYGEWIPIDSVKKITKSSSSSNTDANNDSSNSNSSEASGFPYEAKIVAYGALLKSGPGDNYQTYGSIDKDKTIIITGYDSTEKWARTSDNKWVFLYYTKKISDNNDIKNNDSTNTSVHPNDNKPPSNDSSNTNDNKQEEQNSGVSNDLGEVISDIAPEELEKVEFVTDPGTRKDEEKIMYFEHSGDAHAGGFYYTDTYNGKTVFSFKFTTNYQWTVSASEYISIYNKDTNQSISSGDAGTYTLYIWLNQTMYFEKMFSDMKNNGVEQTLSDLKQTSKITFNIKEEVYSYNFSTFRINGKSSVDYYSSIKSLLNDIKKSKYYNTLDYLCGKSSTDNNIIFLQYDVNTVIAITSKFSDECNLEMEYMVFETFAQIIPDTENNVDKFETYLGLIKTEGMIIRADNVNDIPMFTTLNNIDSVSLNISDTIYETDKKKYERKTGAAKLLANFAISKTTFGPITQAVMGKYIEETIDLISNGDFESSHVNLGTEMIIDEYSATIFENCVMGENDETKSIKVGCYSDEGKILNDFAIIHFVVEDSKGRHCTVSVGVKDKEITDIMWDETEPKGWFLHKPLVKFRITTNSKNNSQFE